MNDKEWMDFCADLQKKHALLEDQFLEKQKAGKAGLISPGGHGKIPVVYATGANLPEAWENSLIALWARGVFVRTQYDRKDTTGYIDPPSKDCTMIMTIEEPLSEPMIHRDFPGGLDALEEYKQEVVDGIKDDWIRDPNDPKDTRWEYTYHGRIFHYEVPGLKAPVDQFDVMAKNLANSPVTRRAQVITWKPWEDMVISDPACLQSIWGRILRDQPEGGLEFYADEVAGKPKLNLNWRFRSRDAYGAAFMNDYAIIMLGAKLARRVSELRGEEVSLGRVVDCSDSYHLYGKDYKQFLGTFTRSLTTRHFSAEGERDMKARTWRSDSELIKAVMAEARQRIPEKLAAERAKFLKR
jgi:thymidylate synthase